MPSKESAFSQVKFVSLMRLPESALKMTAPVPTATAVSCRFGSDAFFSSIIASAFEMASANRSSSRITLPVREASFSPPTLIVP